MFFFGLDERTVMGQKNEFLHFLGRKNTLSRHRDRSYHRLIVLWGEKIEKEISKRIILVVDHLGKEDIMIKIAMTSF